MKQFVLTISMILLFCMHGWSQEMRIRNYWLCGLGPDFQIIIQQPKVEYPSKINFENVTYKQKATLGYYIDVNYVFLINKSLLLQAGINYITRKTHIIYNSDSAIKYSSSIIDRKTIYHNIEFPVLFGVSFGDVQIGTGVKYPFITTVVEETEHINGLKSCMKYSSFGFPTYPVPTLFFRYNINKPGNLKANINFDLRNKYQLDIGVGISYAFNIMK